jgi:hypothetical protein
MAEILTRPQAGTNADAEVAKCNNGRAFCIHLMRRSGGGGGTYRLMLLADKLHENGGFADVSPPRLIEVLVNLAISRQLNEFEKMPVEQLRDLIEMTTTIRAPNPPPRTPEQERVTQLKRNMWQPPNATPETEEEYVEQLKRTGRA